MTISLAELDAKPIYGRDGRQGTRLQDEGSWLHGDTNRVALKPSDRIRLFYDAYSGSAFIEKKVTLGWKRVPELELDFELNGMQWLRSEVLRCGATMVWGNINKCPYGTKWVPIEK